MADKVDKVEDPSPQKFWRLALIVAVILIIVGIIILILGKLVAGGIIALLGGIFGLGAKVASSSSLE